MFDKRLQPSPSMGCQTIPLFPVKSIYLSYLMWFKERNSEVFGWTHADKNTTAWWYLYYTEWCNSTSSNCRYNWKNTIAFRLSNKFLVMSASLTLGDDKRRWQEVIGIQKLMKGSVHHLRTPTTRPVMPESRIQESRDLDGRRDSISPCFAEAYQRESKNDVQE